MHTSTLEPHGGMHMISEAEQFMEEEGKTGAQPEWIVNPAVFGRYVRALRVIEGYDSVTQLGHAVFVKTGVSISDRTLYMIERGEQPPSLDVFFAIAVTLKPDAGMAYFDPAIRGDLLPAIKRLWNAGN